MKAVVIGMLRAYKRWFSPALPVSCRFVPTCSEYAMQAIEEHGILHGIVLSVWRVLRCNPLGGSGYDPVPTKQSCERTPLQPCHHSHDSVAVSAASDRAVGAQL